MRSRRRIRRTRLSLTLARLRRSTVATLAAATSAALLAAALTVRSLEAADEGRRRWGDTVTVDVVTRSVDALTIIPVAAIERRQMPAHLAPEGLATAAAGRISLAAMEPGDVLVEARLATTVMPAGWRAVAVPVPASGAHPEVSIGDAVDVLDVAGADAPVVASGTVVALDDAGTVTIGVPAASAGAVAYAALMGTAVLTLIAVPPRR